VAPLLLVGVAKYAPGLPVSSEFPYLHLDRQFMHLGFYIYDLGFQSPHLETVEGLVFATALLLVLIVLFLNIAAVILRSRLREAFKSQEAF
jgi:phosphate transport system permease protein